MMALPVRLLAQESFPEPKANPAAALLGGGLCFVFWIAALVVAILLMIWIYKDAKSRGQNAILWLILTFFFGIIAVVVWLIIRPKEKIGEAPKSPEPPTKPA